jgi:hypothetical protein
LYASAKKEAFMELYTQILDYGAVPFGHILRHVRDKPTESFLFHCTGAFLSASPHPSVVNVEFSWKG